MRRSVGMGQIGGALVLGVALSLVGVTAWAEEKPAKAAKAEKKAAPEEGVPSWVNWLNAGLPFDFQLTGLDVEGGYRFIGGDRSSAKFQEYRVLQESPYFDHAAFSLETKDKKRYVEFYTFDPFKNDQSYNLRAGKYGDYEMEIFWDQIPHVMSTTGRTAFGTIRNDSTADFALGLSSAERLAVQNASATAPPGGASPKALLLTGLLNSRAAAVDLGFTTSKGGLKLKYNLTESMDLGVKYTYTEKEGTIPLGPGFGSPGGNIVELPAPVFNQTHLAEAKLQYARPGWNIGGGYTGSFFNQGINNITFDNPLFVTPPTPTNPNNSTQGLSTMDPSNQAHNVFLTGGISLPLRTRITGKFSYGWRLQDDPFVQHTINPALLAQTPGSPGNPCPGVTTSTCLQLPRSSLDADIRTTLATFNISSRPFALPLTLSGGYRYFDYDDQTQEVLFQSHVVRDLGPVVVGSEVNAPFSYTKHNANLNAGYQLLSNLNLKLGYEWERWERNPDHREVPNSDEHTLKTSLDYSPLDWLLLRAAYRRGWRSVDKYNTQAHEAHVVGDIEGETFELEKQGQSPLGRKFDEANRTRDRVELLASITPLESLNFTVIYSLLHDDFDKSRPPQDPFNDTSPLGLQESTGWSISGDLAYSPFKWLSLFVNYTREEFRYDQLSRSRPVINLGTPSAAIAPGCDPGSSPNTVGCDFPDFNWRSVNTDTIDTYGVGADISLIPNRLAFKLTWSFSDADTIIRSFNPVTPFSGQPVGTGGSPAPANQRGTATAVNFPTDNTNLHTLIAALRYKLTKNWSLKGEYRWEQFRETNFQTDTIGLTGLAGLPATTDVFLGARFVQDYDAHIGAVTLRYSF
jgi:MtrB/PioB family decaheme-associated outer membrane protein